MERFEIERGWVIERRRERRVFSLFLFSLLGLSAGPTHPPFTDFHPTLLTCNNLNFNFNPSSTPFPFPIPPPTK
ncbi:hypothetical protein GYH30_056236 [Glycine max]|uniref:Uncharacterized protein n=1 Tax=Glycine max TaxID=3847 RepID=K7N477_SOYBN|nr:hypothetical protein GYH30_056236 [Glycine max]